MKIEPTRKATIYIGTKHRASGDVAEFNAAEFVCQKYCNEAKLCVSITQTQYVYTNGREPGIIVGLINYPRFPCTSEALDRHAMALARLLKEALRQGFVSVECANGQTYMLEPDD